MASIVLDDRAATIPEWAVVGEHSRHGDNLVVHVGLAAAEQGDVHGGGDVAVHHMGPPLSTLIPLSEASEDSPPGEDDKPKPILRKLSLMRAHVVGFLAGLTDQERKGMRNWVRDVATRFPAADLRPRPLVPSPEYYRESHFIAHPPFLEEIDAISCGGISQWFSCAGFVLKCYAAGVTNLISYWLTDGFPTVDVEVLTAMYLKPGMESVFAEYSSSLNLPDPGPWPIVMPGYILHSLARDEHEIRRHPYAPKSQDRAFPPT